MVFPLRRDMQGVFSIVEAQEDADLDRFTIGVDAGEERKIVHCEEKMWF